VRITKDRSRTKVLKAIVTKSHFAADKLYNERLSAGLGWERGAKEGMFTVQLMALASKTAEKNLKKMLAQNNYRQEAGNFYILKKSTASEKIFVFYGEYPSLERARLVTNSLPKFLRDHKPYVLSIKGAVAKIRN
jgi:septal ring-binding cell division protein DamX